MNDEQRIARLELVVRELLRVTDAENVIGPSMAPARELIAEVDRVPGEAMMRKVDSIWGPGAHRLAFGVTQETSW